MPARARGRSSAAARRPSPANRRTKPTHMLAWLRRAYAMTDAEVAGMFQVSERTAAQWQGGQVPPKYHEQIAFAYQYHHAAWVAHDG